MSKQVPTLIPRADEVAFYISGVLELMQNKPDGLRYFPDDKNAVIRSFMAYIWCLPVQLFDLSSGWTKAVREEGIYEALFNDGTHISAQWVYLFNTTIFDIFSWILSAFIIIVILAVFSHQEKISRMIVIMNWYSVPITYVMLLPLSINYYLGLPDVIMTTIILIVVLTILIFFYRLSYITLRGDGTVAGVLTALNLINWIVLSLLFVQIPLT